MKKIFLYIAITLGLLSCNHKDSLWQEVVEDLDERVETLEVLCAEMNTNITSLQTIVDVLQSNDFITSIVEIKKDGKVVGYTITFGKHDPITIYHGQDGKNGQNGTNGKDGQDGADGKDGQNGADGKDGSTPVIGVAQDTDGVYYWTLNGEWLLDDNGNKLPVSGADGKDGANGADGKDGQNGTDGKDGQDGKDGVTPQLKIEEGYWFISYDNGATWTQLGKATGEDGKDGVDGEDGKDGQNGADGKDGQDGDSIFQSVTQDENYVYFTLADGTVIKIAKGSGSNDQPNSEFIFTITYDPNGGEGVMEKDTFYYDYSVTIDYCQFTKEGYFFKEWNTRQDGTGVSYTGGRVLNAYRNITLYAQWGSLTEGVDLGLSVKWASVNIGANKPEEYGDYFAWGETEPKKSYDYSTYKWLQGKYYTLTKYNTDYDFGNTIDNKIVLDKEDDAAVANWGGSWRMPTVTECIELNENCIWTPITQNGVKGYQIKSKKNGNTIFLPAAGSYSQGRYFSEGQCACWSSSLCISYPGNAHTVSESTNALSYGTDRCEGLPIRPVCP